MEQQTQATAVRLSDRSSFQDGQDLEPLAPSVWERSGRLKSWLAQGGIRAGVQALL